jgi:DNA-binding CsgD family transcriptional regulator
MSEFNEIIRNNRHLNTRLKKLCEPLFHNFGFNSLFYHHISTDGYATSFGSHIESYEEYLHEHLFKSNPYVRHPGFFQSSLQLITDIKDEVYQAGLNVLADKFKLTYKVVFIEKTENGCQGFSFAVNKNAFCTSPSNIINHIPLLQCFINRFKEDGADIIKNALEEQISCDKHLGKEFFKKPTLIIPSTDETKKIQFLKEMGMLHHADDIALSQREKQCIRYLLQGYTAAETAQLLNLSKRTVESYLQNIKLKMNCYTKVELFEKFKDVEALGVL